MLFPSERTATNVNNKRGKTKARTLSICSKQSERSGILYRVFAIAPIEIGSLGFNHAALGDDAIACQAFLRTCTGFLCKGRANRNGKASRNHSARKQLKNHAQQSKHDRQQCSQQDDTNILARLSNCFPVRQLEIRLPSQPALLFSPATTALLHTT